MKKNYFALLVTVVYLLNMEVRAQNTFSKEYPFISRFPVPFEQFDGYLTVADKLMKINFTGDTLWTKNLEDLNLSAMVLRDADSDGNIFMITGLSGSDSSVLTKIDQNGNVIWRHTYLWASLNKAAYANGFVWTVYTDDSYDTYLSKTDATTGQESGVYFVCNVTENTEEWVTSLAVKDDGEISIATALQYYMYSPDVYGTKLHTKSADSDSFTSVSLNIADTAQINYITTILYVGDELWGVTNSIVSSNIHYFLRFGATGEVYSILPVILGQARSGIYNFVVNNDQDAVLLCEQIFTYPTKESLLLFISPDDSVTQQQLLPEPELKYIKYCSDEGYIIAGNTLEHFPYLHKTDSQGLLTAVPSLVAQQEAHVYPNPVKGVITIRIEKMENEIVTIYDSFGRMITRLSLQDGETRWDVSAMKSGIYYYSVGGVKGKVVVRK